MGGKLLGLGCVLGFLLAGCAADRAAANKRVVGRLIEAINTRDLDALDQLVAEDVRRHSTATPGLRVESLEEFKAFLQADFAAVPDSRQEAETLLSEGDLVAGRCVYSGTQAGPMGPFPATGKRFELPFMVVLRLEDGKVAELWVEWDNMHWMSQVGLIPPPEEMAMWREYLQEVDRAGD